MIQFLSHVRRQNCINSVFYVFVSYWWPIEVLSLCVRQCCSWWSLCGDCTGFTLKRTQRDAVGSSDGLSFARWNADSLNEQAVGLVKQGTIALLTCWWHTCFISPQTAETNQNSLVPSWPAASSIYMKTNHDSSVWPRLLPKRRFCLCLQLCQKTLMQCLTAPRCLPVHWTQPGNKVFCYSVHNGSELVVSTKDLQVSSLSSLELPRHFYPPVLHLCTWRPWVFLSVHVALNSLAPFQAWIPLLPGSKFILSADLICDQNWEIAPYFRRSTLTTEQQPLQSDLPFLLIPLNPALQHMLKL